MIIDNDRISRLHVLVECDAVLTNVGLPILEFEEPCLKLCLRLSYVS